MRPCSYYAPAAGAAASLVEGGGTAKEVLWGLCSVTKNRRDGRRGRDGTSLLTPEKKHGGGKEVWL